MNPSAQDESPVKNHAWKILLLALAVRVLAADALQVYLERQGNGRPWLFPDTAVYWQLAQTIRDGATYQVVDWNDIPHFALRTPGYPLLIAVCLALFGDRTLPVRLVQAVLGAFCVVLVHRLARVVLGAGSHGARGSVDAPRTAAWLIALHPYAVLGSVILLSEALFVPLMLLALVGLAVVWEGRGSQGGWGWLVAIATGAAAGAAVLTRPSWGLFPPLVLAAMVCANRFRGRSIGTAVLVVLGIVLVMAPWWVRNERVFGRFVPTALWMGASLYDGLNPRADGSSDMRFMEDDLVWPLDEEDQDRELTRRAVAFAREHPGRALELAANKLGRYWRPWPRVEGVKGLVVIAVGAVVELPLLGLMVLGLWGWRREPRAWVLLAGPIVYFCVVHLVFASSMRYRLPGEPAALVLAAAGWGRLGRRGGLWARRFR